MRPRSEPFVPILPIYFYQFSVLSLPIEKNLRRIASSDSVIWIGALTELFLDILACFLVYT